MVERKRKIIIKIKKNAKENKNKDKKRLESKENVGNKFCFILNINIDNDKIQQKPYIIIHSKYCLAYFSEFDHGTAVVKIR